MTSLYIKMKENNFENIWLYLPNYINATPTPQSSYFKLDRVMEVTSDEIDIKMSKN